MDPNNQKCGETILEDYVNHSSPVRKRKRLESDKSDKVDCKDGETNDVEQGEEMCTPPEEFIEKGKSDKVGCKDCETNDVEQGEGICTSPEEIIEKDDNKNKCDEKDQQSNEMCVYVFGEESCKCVEQFKKEECEKNVTILLPSSVTDREEIYFPPNISNDDPSIYGKWLIFTNGNLRLQNHVWIQLQKLVQNKDLILLGSSTAKLCENRGTFQGVIKCYTSKDIMIIRRAGLLIQNILKDDCILDYKTNEASQKNLYRANGNRFITTFMLTMNGKLYKRDKLGRFTQITDAEYENFRFEEKISEKVTPITKKEQSESNLLPSLETRKKKKRYVYPEKSQLCNWSGLWCLFCDVADTDADGLTELDRVWNDAKALCDKNYFKSIHCETYAFQHPSKESIPRRTVMCEVEFPDIKLIIKFGNALREKVSYNFPIYYKFFVYNDKRKVEYKLKYLYTEDRELYEYTERKWKLLKKA